MNLDFDFPIEIIRTNRKRSASIKVVGISVIVTVPKSVSDRRIEDLVRQRTNWIRQKLKLLSETPPSKPKEYVNGEAFTYLGRNYRLKRTVAPISDVKLKNGYLQVPIPPDTSKGAIKPTVKSSLESWYKAHALIRLTDKTKRYAKIIGVCPKAITVRDYKSRWGSCSASGIITYNWRIIMAPHRIVDYVVVHELSHLLEHNHSPKYWRHVENVIADYSDCREWLKLNGSNLVI